MSKFDPEQLMANPDSGAFEKLKKDDLLGLWKHLGLDVRTAIKVEDLRSVVSQYLAKEGVLKEPVSQNSASLIDRLELSEKYKYELALKKLEYEQRESVKESGRKESVRKS